MPAKRKASATASAGSPASATSAAVPPVKKARVAAAEPAEAAAPPVAEAPPSVSTTSARQPEAGPSSRPARTKAKVATVPRPKKRKLAPPKPPGAGLPAGAAVTGPTGQIKGRDVVLVSRRAELGSYMRKCKALMVEEGLRTITLHALSASIPHLFLLLHSLLAILPFPRSAVHHSIKTSSVKMTDELIPDDEEEPITLGERWCSAVEIIISVGEQPGGKDGVEAKKTRRKKRGKGKGKGVEAAAGGPVLARTSTSVKTPMAIPTSVVLEYDEDDEMAAMNG